MLLILSDIFGNTFDQPLPITPLTRLMLAEQPCPARASKCSWWKGGSDSHPTLEGEGPALTLVFVPGSPAGHRTVAAKAIKRWAKKENLTVSVPSATSK